MPQDSALSIVFGSPTGKEKRYRKAPIKIQNHLRRLRLERGLTVQQVSDATGLSNSTLHALEKQERHVTLVTAFKLAYFYDSSVEHIWQPLFEDYARSSPTETGLDRTAHRLR